MDRRTFITTTAAAGTTIVAGCGGSSDSNGSDDGETDSTSTESGSTTGEFRLLISDQPAAIGDFDSLDVTFDRARVFRKQGDGEETPTEATETSTTENGTAEPTANGTQTPEATENETVAMDDEEMDEEDETEDEEDGEGGFTVFELDSPTVDLTEVVGDRAIGVLDGKLETGEYTKIELHVSDVEGIVDGETVDVKVPSNKLQITKPFEVTAEEPVEFVFDINVVEKGNGGYNLLPVISESGVAGTDVDVEEVGSDDTEPTAVETTETDTVTNETTDNESTTNETATDA